SRFVLERSEALVGRLEREGIVEPAARIKVLYHWLFQRDPTEREFAKLINFVKDSPDAWQLVAQTLLASNEFYFCN
ncbi:MAG: hypothetical protein ACKOAH_24550, partial [Pirellula sp.]